MSANTGEEVCLPFHHRGDFFPAMAHEEAIARLLFLAEHHWPAGWLAGPGGCGKTRVLSVVSRHLRSLGREAVYFSTCGIDAEEFWTELARRLGSRQRETGLAARRTVRGLLAASAMINRPVAMLLDDVDLGAESLWNPIAGLVRIAEGLSPRHTVILATSGAPPAGDLASRIDLRASVAPFTAEETRAYITTRLTGGTIGFDEEASDELYRLTAGAPGMINRLADLALVTAEASGHEHVSADLVRSAFEELRPLDETPLLRFTAEPEATRASA